MKDAAARRGFFKVRPREKFDCANRLDAPKPPTASCGKALTPFGISHHRQQSQAALRSTTPDFSSRSQGGAARLREQPSGIEQATKFAALVREPLAAASTDRARIL